MHTTTKTFKKLQQTKRDIFVKRSTLFTATVALGLVFAILLLIRTGIFEPKEGPIAVGPSPLAAEDTWMGIFQNGEKIGYTHKTIGPIAEGYDVSEFTYMKINMMGMVQEIHVTTGGRLNPDFALQSFNFSMKSNLFKFITYGSVKEGKLILFVNGKRQDIPIDGDIHLNIGLVNAAWKGGLPLGKAKTFHIFDPSTMTNRPITLTAEKEETMEVMDQAIQVTRIAVDFMDTRQVTWVDEKGEVVKEEGMMGISLVKSTKNEAMADILGAPTADLTKNVAIEPDGKIDNPHSRKRLRLRLANVPKHLSLQGGRQTFNDNILTIVKETVPVAVGRPAPTAELLPYLQPAPFVQSDHPDIRKIAHDIEKTSHSAFGTLSALLTWMNEHIDKRPVVSIPDALETLKNKVGDCNEHAVLFAALARAAGIPTRIESGVVYMDGKFYYHAWNGVYLDGKWITVDSALNQFPADVTHIRLVTGGIEKQVDLLSVIGKLTISLLEAHP